jgi:hypothetical protein|tara:strand:- start:97 stop:729 length:633 start_codon:yes stop_codon:yes gene_type:complete
MKKLLIIILLNLVCNSALSEPSEKSWIILTHPVSIMDWALMKLRETEEEGAKILENMSSRTDCTTCNIIRGYEIPPIKVASHVNYNDETDKIIIGLEVYTNEEDVDILELCEVLRNDLSFGYTGLDKFTIKNKKNALALARVNFVNKYFSQVHLLDVSIYSHIVNITETKVLLKKYKNDESVICSGNINSVDTAFQRGNFDTLWNKHFFR